MNKIFLDNNSTTPLDPKVLDSMIPFFLEKYQDLRVINLDLLTYAGNLDNLSVCEKNERYTFIKGDICEPSNNDPI